MDLLYVGIGVIFFVVTIVIVRRSPARVGS